MKHDNYFPIAVLKRRSWAVRYKNEIAVSGLAMGMSPAEIAAEQAFCDKMIDAIDVAQLAKIEAKAKNKAKDMAIKQSMDKLRVKIRNHKSNPAYSVSMGKALGVIGSELTIDKLSIKSKVVLFKAPQGVGIKFNLKHCEGGNVYCQRGNEEQFTFFKYVTHPRTIDTRPNLNNADSEMRQYYVVLVVNDEEIGLASDIATIKN
jgi:hypothetical protein